MAHNFDFISRLGAGHFGEVWLVREIALDVQKALKLIPPDKIPNKSNFFQEAQILKSVEHPNVVRVDEAGTMLDGRIYVAMEYLERGSLEDEAKGAFVPLTRAKSLMIDVLRGLEFAHSKNILHRDIKPGNILVDDNRRGKLSDFGLALPIGVNPKTLGMKGYLYTAHMAPEILQGGAFDVASEIYACGVTLYRLVNGDYYLPPFDPATIVNDVITGKFPNRARYREFIPRRIRTAINRAMYIDPTKRFGSASDMRHAIEQFHTNINWNESAYAGGIRWSGTAGGKTYAVTRFLETDGTWSVVLKKGPNKRKLRTMRAHSVSGVARAKAIQQTKHVLQHIVMGKIV